jgi:hypothetical protein
VDIDSAALRPHHVLEKAQKRLTRQSAFRPECSQCGQTGISRRSVLEMDLNLGGCHGR